MTTNTIELNENDQIFEPDCLKRTNFFVSFCYLTIQVLIPGLLLFFLTSKDFSFTFKLPLWLMFVLSFAFLLFALIMTFITYKFKLHQLDQFTYVVLFVFFIVALYLTSYWLNYHYFLIRFIIAFAFAVIGIFFASVILLLVIRKK
ncbi:MAG: DxFTY motif-containing membrane protein [Spiroplasma sp.]